MSRNCQILIVDDQKPNRDLLNDLVLILGHSPLMAENGLSALAQIKQNLPDLILLDIMMPEMDGFQVLEKLKSDNALCHIPVIMISAVDDIENVARCIEKGAVDYLVKPFNPTLLKARISSSLASKAMRDQEDNYRKQIEKYNLTLEDKVRERTRELEKSLEAVELANRVKTNFIANMNHEIRTPMNAILGYLQMLIGDGALNRTQTDHLKEMDKSSHRLLALIDDILKVSQVEFDDVESSMIDFNIQDLVNGISSLYQHRCKLKGLAWTRDDLEFCPEWVHGDPLKLKQILSNLLHNAVKFTGSGEVKFQISQKEDERIQFDIIDTGKGIAIEEQEKIFEPFFQNVDKAKKEGTGLGLPIARKLVEFLGGNLNIQSAPGEGSKFSFRLKFPPARVPNQPANQKEDSPVTPKDPDLQDIDWSRVNIPEATLNRLSQVCEAYNVTGIKKIITEIKSFDSKNQKLCAQIENYLKSYNMDAILELIKSANNSELKD